MISEIPNIANGMPSHRPISVAHSIKPSAQTANPKMMVISLPHKDNTSPVSQNTSLNGHNKIPMRMSSFGTSIFL